MLLIPGATGDAGTFTTAATRLADEFTVITYDRRGNSRSRATGDPMAAATMSAQADDAADLIVACGFNKAVVYGNSGGAIIALELLARRPTMVKGAVVHEPPLIALLPQDGPNLLEPIFQLAQTDPRAALEAFVRVNTSDAAWEAIDSGTRERILGNGETLFAREMGQFISYQPDEAVLRAQRVPVVLLRSRDGLEFAPHVLAWLQDRLGVEVGTLSGQHSPFLDIPEVFAEELRPILRRLWN
ncbi:MAG TPA: alpha/beta hydrolase [Candidatus Limnocylindria bacterium]